MERSEAGKGVGGRGQPLKAKSLDAKPPLCLLCRPHQRCAVGRTSRSAGQRSDQYRGEAFGPRAREGAERIIKPEQEHARRPSSRLFVKL